MLTFFLQISDVSVFHRGLVGCMPQELPPAPGFSSRLRLNSGGACTSLAQWLHTTWNTDEKAAAGAF